MNIFFLDADPIIAAQQQCDKHVVKMPLESAQMLCTVHRVIYPKEQCDALNLYREAYKKHPCTVWAGAAKGNYEWLFKHFVALCEEYRYRFKRTHKSSLLIPALSVVPAFAIGPMQPPAQAMPDYCRTNDPVSAYRNYYRKCKHNIAKWQRAPERKPAWFEETT